MNQFQVSPVKRLISRIYFYATVLLGSFFVGNLIPSDSDRLNESALQLGAAKIYLGVPLSKVPAEFRPK